MAMQKMPRCRGILRVAQLSVRSAPRVLVAALSAVFGDGIEMDLKPGGMHAGLAVEALSNRTITHARRPALLLEFTNVAESDASDMSQQLKRAIGSQLRAQASKSK
jgi:hypothetical protein